MHLEILVEELSAKVALERLLPKLLPVEITYRIIAFQNKQDLLKKLPQRMRGYARYLGADDRVVVLVDKDQQDCYALKRQLENAARDAGLTTTSHLDAQGRFQVLSRIVVEELEAWFFGDAAAIRAAYPRVSAHLGKQRKYRDPDAIRGGTWESLEQVLRKAGYFKSGLNKIEAARAIAEHMQPANNNSASFRCFVAGLQKLR